MKKDYVVPTLTPLGSTEHLTGIFSDPSVSDVSIGPNGQVIGTGNGSIDQCASADLSKCL